MPVEDVHEAEYTGTPWKLIVRRIKYSGYSPEEALFEDYNEQDTEMKERKRLSQLEHEDRMRLVRLERQKELDLRRKKPHLFEVPQVHPRREWCVHLMKYDIFPKRVVRS